MSVTMLNEKPAHMLAVMVQGDAAPQQMLAVQRVAVPEMGPWEVLVRVYYAGVNQADHLQVAGRYPLPEGSNTRLGLEVSGVVVAVGEKVQAIALGDEVAALVDGGGYAEYVAVPASQVWPVFPRCSLAHMACLPEAMAAGYMALVEKAKLQPGETVLIQGAGGNIGPMLAQLAQALGAGMVVAVTRSAEKCAPLAALGAHALCVNDASELAAALHAETGKKTVDVIIDPLGAPFAESHLALLNRYGRLVSMGFLAGNRAEYLPLGRLLTKELVWTGFALRSQPVEVKARVMQALAKTLPKWIEVATITPVIDSIYPLREVNKAHIRLQQHLHCGKILLEVHA